MLKVLSQYQSKLTDTFFQSGIYLLLFFAALSVIRAFLLTEWAAIVRTGIFLIGAIILSVCLSRLRQDADDLMAQHVGGATMSIIGALFIAIAPSPSFFIGIIVLAAILFFTVHSMGIVVARRLFVITTILLFLALAIRQTVPALSLTYSVDLLIALYIFPLLFFWVVIRIGATLVNYLADTLQVSQDLKADLRHQELQYQQLLQTMNEGFVVADEEERFVYVNDKFCEIFGYDRSELMERRNDEVLVYDELNLQILRQQTAIRAEKHRSTYELSTKRKDGTPIQVLISAVPNVDKNNVFRGACCVVMDITERKRALAALDTERVLLSKRVEERTASLRKVTEALQKELQERTQIELALRRAEEEYRTLFDSIPIGIYRTSPEGRQLRANPALVALNGYEHEEELLQAVQDIGTEWYVNKERRQEFQQTLEKEGVVSNFESEIYRHKNRERIWISETATLIRDDEGNPLYYQGTVQEITERKQHEEAQQRLITQLAKVARLKDEFLANMSHELRTPLSSILGMTEAMQDQIYGELNERQRKALGTIETSGRHLLTLINDILDLAKIESGQAELVVGVVDLLALCESCLRLVQPTARKKEIIVNFTIDPQLKIIMADGRRLKQMLLNLLSNAIKFTPNKGSVDLEITVVSTPEALIQFAVSDTGVGIPEEAQAYLFEPFVQVDSSLSRHYEGTGLGLALVHRMAQLHGGHVSVESKVDDGSRFTITLPWVLPNPQGQTGFSAVTLPKIENRSSQAHTMGIQN